MWKHKWKHMCKHNEDNLETQTNTLNKMWNITLKTALTPYCQRTCENKCEHKGGNKSVSACGTIHVEKTMWTTCETIIWTKRATEKTKCGENHCGQLRTVCEAHMWNKHIEQTL